MRRRAVITVVLAGLALTPAAAGSAYSQILQTYQSTGSVPPCRFTSAQLASALDGIDTYGQQYFADFSDAVQSALAARAAGACGPGAHSRLSLAPAPQAPLPASGTATTAASLPLAALALGGLTLVLVIALGAGAVLSRGGWEPGWLISWRHAWGEAGYRIAGGLADLADRWRISRRS